MFTGAPDRLLTADESRDLPPGPPVTFEGFLAVHRRAVGAGHRPVGPSPSGPIHRRSQRDAVPVAVVLPRSSAAESAVLHRESARRRRSEPPWRCRGGPDHDRLTAARSTTSGPSPVDDRVSEPAGVQRLPTTGTTRGGRSDVMQLDSEGGRPHGRGGARSADRAGGDARWTSSHGGEV